MVPCLHWGGVHQRSRVVQSWAGLASALVTIALAPPAGATSVSTNHVALPFEVTIERCQTVAEQSLQRSGLSLLDRTSDAAWGTTPDRTLVVGVYCLVPYGVAVVMAAGPSPQPTDALLTRIVKQLRQAWPE